MTPKKLLITIGAGALLGAVIIALGIGIRATREQAGKYDPSLVEEDRGTSLVNERTKTENTKRLEKIVGEANSSLLSLQEQYKNTKGGTREGILTQLVDQAQERRGQMLALLEESPEVFYQKSFTRLALGQFPGEVKPHLEERVSFKGKVESQFIDFPDFSGAITTQKIIDGQSGEKLKFHSLGLDGVFNSGTVIQVTNAVRLDNEVPSSNTQQISQNKNKSLALIAHAQEEEHILKGSSLVEGNVVAHFYRVDENPPLNSLGTQDVLIIPVRLPDVPESILPTPGEIYSTVFEGRIQEILNKSSYNQFDIQGQVTDWFVTTPPSELSDVLSPNHDELPRKQQRPEMIAWGNVYNNWILPTGIAFVQADGEIDLNDYDGKEIVVILAAREGFFKVGGVGSIVQNRICIGPTSSCLPDPEEPPLVDINASLFAQNMNIKDRDLIEGSVASFNIEKHTSEGDLTRFEKVFLHEMGHTLSLRHASSITCPDNVFSPQNYFQNFDRSYSEECEFSEYGDLFSYMGSDPGTIGITISTHLRRQIQWIGPCSSMGDDLNCGAAGGGYLATTEPGEYTLMPYGSNEGLQSLLLNYQPSGLERYDEGSSRDYYLEYRKFEHPFELQPEDLHTAREDLVNRYLDGNRRIRGLPEGGGLAIVINESSFPSFRGTTKGIGFARKFPEEPIYRLWLKAGESIVDEKNETKITVLEENGEELRLMIEECEIVGSAIAINPLQGNPTTIYDTDFRGSDTGEVDVQLNFDVVNRSPCFSNTYSITNVDQHSKSSYITPTRQALIEQESFEIEPHAKINNSVSLRVAKKSNEEIGVMLADGITTNEPLRVVFAARTDDFTEQAVQSLGVLYVPSIEELGFDLTPDNITMSREVKGIGGQRLDPAEAAGGEVVSFQSNILNNSRNADPDAGTNEFRLRWQIYDPSGRLVLDREPPKHPGLASGGSTNSLLQGALASEENLKKIIRGERSRDEFIWDAVAEKALNALNAAWFEWEVPEDAPLGEYSIFLLIDDGPAASGVNETNELNNRIETNFFIIPPDPNSEALKEVNFLTVSEVEERVSPGTWDAIRDSVEEASTIEEVGQTLYNTARNLLPVGLRDFLPTWEGGRGAVELVYSDGRRKIILPGRTIFIGDWDFGAGDDGDEGDGTVLGAPSFSASVLDFDDLLISEGDPRFFLTPSSEALRIGDELEVEVRLDTGFHNIDGVLAYLAFDLDKLSYLGAGYSSSTFSIGLSEEICGSSCIKIERGQSGGVDSSSAIVAQLRFLALEEGEASIDFILEEPLQSEVREIIGSESRPTPYTASGSTYNITTPPTLGDVNDDQVVDIVDLILVASKFGQSGEGLSSDLDRNNIVDIVDLLTVSTNWTRVLPD